MANLSVHFGLLEKVKTDIAALCTAGTITNVLAANVVRRKHPYFRDLADANRLPAIVVANTQGPIQVQGGTNADEDWSFPLIVAYGEKASTQSIVKTMEEDHDEALHWKEEVILKFVKQHLTLTDPAKVFHDCTIQDGVQIDLARLTDERINCSWLGLSFVTRTLRGN